MKNKKIIYIVIGVLLSLGLIGGIIFFVVNNMKEKNLNQNIMFTVTNYMDAVKTKKWDIAYESLSPEVKGWLSIEEFTVYMEAYMDEENVIFEMDEKRMQELFNEKANQNQEYINDAVKTKDNSVIAQAQAYASRSYTYVPVNRIITKGTGDNAESKEDEFDLTVLFIDGKPSIYFNPEEFYNKKVEALVSKSYDYIIDSMEYNTDVERVTQNIEKIEKYLSQIDKVPSDYRYRDNVIVEINILKAYKYLIKKEMSNAEEYMKTAWGMAQTDDEKIKVKSIEAEIFMAQGKYNDAVSSLKVAVETDEDNNEIKKDYRRVVSMMIDELESKLVSGWAQLKSALTQEEVERKRILKDIALVDANAAIIMKEDAPDGYFLRGSINYLLGYKSQAISDLEKALSLAKTDDTIFRNEVSQVLGLAKTTDVKDNEVIKSYGSNLKVDTRSILIRESRLGGLVDQVKS